MTATLAAVFVNDKPQGGPAGSGIPEVDGIAVRDRDVEHVRSAGNKVRVPVQGFGDGCGALRDEGGEFAGCAETRIHAEVFGPRCAVIG
jgi:hypothetical protein